MVRRSASGTRPRRPITSWARCQRVKRAMGRNPIASALDRLSVAEHPHERQAGRVQQPHRAMAAQ